MQKPKTRRLAIGPGTIVAVLAAIGVFAFRDKAIPAEPSIPPISSARPAPLFKPEPQWLIDRSRTLGLTAAQTAALDTIQAEWSAEKRSRLATMEQSTGTVGVSDRRALSQMQADLRDYAELSRAFDVARTGYWLRAKSVLKPEQLRKGGLL